MSTVDDLRLALALVDRGSMSAAAASLHIAQPSASNRLRSLERRLGIRLFERSVTGTRPTPAGWSYVRRAREILDLMQSAADEARQAVGVQRIRFGTFTSLSVPVFTGLGDLLPEGTLVDQRIQNGSQLIRMIGQGQLDGAVVGTLASVETPIGVQRFELGPDPVLVVAPAGVSLPDLAAGHWPTMVHLASYSSQPDDVARALARKGATPQVAGSAPVALALARHRGELAAVPRTAWRCDARPDERTKQLSASFATALNVVLPRPTPPLLTDLAPGMRRALGLS